MTKASPSRKRRSNTDYRAVHFLVKQTAMEVAGSYYELAATNGRHGDKFYKTFPSQKVFMDNQWPNFVMIAKDLMTTIMANPMTPEAQRQDIYHALLLDATLPYSSQEAQITNFRVN